jgi:hypothetical protein
MRGLGYKESFQLGAELKLVAILKLSLAALLLVGALATAHAVASGRTMFWTGDDSQRVIRSFDYAHRLPCSFSAEDILGAVWPPGQFLLQGSLIKLLLAVGVRDLLWMLQVLQLMSVVMWTIGIYAIYRATAASSGPLCGTLAGISLTGLPALLSLSYSGLSEVYTFAIVSLGLFWF